MTLDEQTYLQAVGTRVRQRREALGLSQAELGQRCGLHRTFIGHVERGERNAAILNLRQIARTLRLPLREMLAEPPEEPA